MTASGHHALIRTSGWTGHTLRRSLLLIGVCGALGLSACSADKAAVPDPVAAVTPKTDAATTGTFDSATWDATIWE